MLILSVDQLAHRYHCLPSEVLEKATTLDLYILNVASQWENYKYKEAEAKAQGKPGSTAHNYSQDQLLNILNTVKGKKK